MIHQLDCVGCGQALAPEQGRRGSLRRLHPECAFVRRTWHRLREVSGRLARYHRLKAAGARRDIAVWACSSELRTQAALEVVVVDSPQGSAPPDVH